MLFLLLSMEELSAKQRALSSGEYESLLLGIAQGDSACFERLYRATDRTLYAYALSLTRNHHDAQDIMMETYLKIQSAAHLYRPLGKPLAWIFTIAKNIARSKYRLSSRETSLEELSQWEDPGASFEQREDQLALQAALRVLGSEERQIVLLHAVTGLKHREIAALMELPLSTVLSRYTRALSKLKKHLARPEEVEL